ncbi:MAG: hypothetical protein KAJ20_03235 [Candidatus Aenigmarchaeota archaeon]|nr:hypothetical protein [Candidatus Aenigmarchaeota archaeon]MCK5289869.1 hypothetical protein [Candidatus Aenigmarchaeota archaeon]MCK5373326.1 hypothetical protein [Candidatus Aenigmarchaeota archaeon]
MGQMTSLNKPRDYIQQFFLNINRPCSGESIEQIIRDKPSLAKDDVDNILAKYIRYVKYEDVVLGLIRCVDYGKNTDSLVFDIVINRDDDYEEQTKSKIHEILHVYYRLTGSSDACLPDLVEDLLEDETERIYDEMPGLARYIFNSCLFRAVEPDVY